MISDSLKKVYQDIHKTTPFGKRSKFPKYLEEYIRTIKPNSILDFGCGKGNLISKIKETFPTIDVYGYDPANPMFEKNLDEMKVDMLISSDVLEHVEPEFIDKTIEELKTKSKYFFHLIACSPAKLILPDGRNAHLIIENNDYWRDKFLSKKYKIQKEDFMQFYKTPKGQKNPMLVKKYFIMGETHG